MAGIVFKGVATPQERDQAMAVRREVFIIEQGISEVEEYDGLDDVCLHFAAIEGAMVVGTARIRFPTPDCAKIERMAVLKPLRRRGVGAGILACIESELIRRRTPKAVLHAQVTAAPFYQACGYSPVGEHFLEADIEHVRMEKRLPGE